MIEHLWSHGGQNKNQVINILEKFEAVDAFWTPKIIESMNDYHLKIAKFKDQFTWHIHTETDEVFIVMDGVMTILFETHEVNLKAGDLYVVPKGILHKPIAEEVCKVLMIEPAGTINTGDVENQLTIENPDWL